MKLNMPDKVKETALKPGYYALSPEVLPEFAGDYIIFSKNPDADNSFQFFPSTYPAKETFFQHRLVLSNSKTETQPHFSPEYIFGDLSHIIAQIATQQL
jgi:iron complex transport system substrate-binding protein